MKTMSVTASVEETINKLEHYLVLNNYKSVDINRSSGVISGVREKTFFRNSRYLWLIVKKESEDSTLIELKLNPQKGKRSDADEIRELKLRSKIFFFVAGARP
jgi:hypothetical protein